MESEMKPKARSNHSSAWNHFYRIGSFKSCLACCSYCGCEVAVPSGSTTGMFSHLQIHHPNEYRQAKDQQKQKHDQARLFKWDTPLPLETRPISPLEYQEEAVLVKSMDVDHDKKIVLAALAKLYSGLDEVDLTLLRAGEEPSYDVVFHCADGSAPAHKVIFAAVSPLLKDLLRTSDTSQIFLPDVKKSSFRVFLEWLYLGSPSQETSQIQHISSLLGIEMVVQNVDRITEERGAHINEDMLSVSIKEEDIDIEMNEDCMRLEDVPVAVPVLLQQPENSKYSGIQKSPVIDLGQNFSPHFQHQTAKKRHPSQFPPNSQLENDYRLSSPPLHIDLNLYMSPESKKAQDELDVQANELKNKIFAECEALKRKRGEKSFRVATRTPSKIWKWFSKSSKVIVCKVCGFNMKNCGNTTNAACHLRKHPKEYLNFKSDSADHDHLMVNEKPLLASNDEQSQKAETPIWRYFVKPSTAYNRKAKCLMCNVGTPSGESNLLLHLEHHHPFLFEKVTQEMKTGL